MKLAQLLLLFCALLFVVNASRIPIPTKKHAERREALRKLVEEWSKVWEKTEDDGDIDDVKELKNLKLWKYAAKRGIIIPVFWLETSVTPCWYYYNVDKKVWFWSPYKPKNHKSIMSKLRWMNTSTTTVEHNVFRQEPQKGKKPSKENQDLISYLDENQETAIKFLKAEVEAQPSTQTNTMMPPSERIRRFGKRSMAGDIKIASRWVGNRLSSGARWVADKFSSGRKDEEAIPKRADSA